MYHGHFNGTHYEVGFRWGTALRRRGRILLEKLPFFLTEERMEFSRCCLPFYEFWYPEILEEIRGIADGQEIAVEPLLSFLLGMYCIMPENRCSCFAFQTENNSILARNSDFLTEIENLCMNCIYTLEGAHSFTGNTTAFVEMEDGANEHGLAIGLTAIWPRILAHGLNAGMLLRYGLEKCKTAEEFIGELTRLPIASSQTFTVADHGGSIALVECNPEKVIVKKPGEAYPFVSAVNSFYCPEMAIYTCTDIDTWNSEKRFATIQNAFRDTKTYDMDFAKNLLAGRYGFMCQYDRKTGRDTVWSVIYDMKCPAVYRCEGNPLRKNFTQDIRFKFSVQP